MSTESNENQSVVNIIETRSSLGRMSDDELASLHALHEVEITKITGRIELYGHSWKNYKSAKQARRVMQLHKTWIEREQRGREAAKRNDQKAKNREFAQSILNAAASAKAERQKVFKEKDMQDIAVFKSVCREVVGDEMYQHIW